MRINARLDKVLARKLRHLVAVREKSITEVVREAIELYYEQVEGETPCALETLEAQGFVGCGEGPVDLSASYKMILSGSLEAKHGDRG